MGRGLPGFLIVVPWNPEGPGGVGQVVSNLLDQVTLHRAYEPVLLVTSWFAPRLREREEAGRARFNLRLRPAFGAGRPVRTLLGFLAAAPATAREILSLVRTCDVCVINVHYVQASSLLLGLLRRAGFFRGCLLLSVHGTDLHTAASSRRLQRACWRLTFRLADRIVACSARLREDVIAFDPKLGPKVVTVRNGVDVNRLTMTRSLRGRLPERLGSAPCILSVAKFDPVKGLDVLVRAFALVLQEMAGVCLVLVGASRAGEAQIVDLVASLGLSDSVTLIKDVPHEEMGEFYSRAAVFCLPSRREALGIAILEAGAFGLPVVATRVGGIPEVIDHGVTGRLVEPDDVGGLAHELLFLLANGSERERLGKALRNRVETEFTWAKAYSRYAAIAKECSGKSSETSEEPGSSNPHGRGGNG